MPIAGCSSPGNPSSGPNQSCDDPSQSCGKPEKLTGLTVLEGANTNGVEGQDRWATVQDRAKFVIIEAATEPNTAQTWSRLQWSGDAGEAVPGHANRRRLPRSTSTILRPSVSLAGESKALELWVLGVKIEIKAVGKMPPNAAPFLDLLGKPQPGDLGLDVGPPAFPVGTEYPGGVFIVNMHVRGKIVAVAKITPRGAHAVAKVGWTFRRERWTKQWENGNPGSQTTAGWVDDTSRPDFLRLTPDADDTIYDTDGPDIRWGTKSYEIHHNFRQQVSWMGESFPDYGTWYFYAGWKANKDQSKQIVFKGVGPGQITLPDKPQIK